MTITTLPTRDAADLGAALSNVRSPVANEFSAVNLEKIKDWIIALASEVGKTDGSTAGSLRAAIDDLGGGALFELDTTVTTGLQASTDVEGEYGAGAGAPAGTLSVAANVAADWNADEKVLVLSTSADFQGLLARRVLCGDLPAEGYILDVGVAGVTGGSVGHALILVGYQPGAAADEPTGLGLYFSEAASAPAIMAIGDAGTGAPHTPTAVANGPTWGSYYPTAMTLGPYRVVVEFRKTNGATPTARWSMRIRTWGRDAVSCGLASGVEYPDSGFSTPIALDGFSPTRIAVGCWNQSIAAAGAFKISHLRVYPLGALLPA